MNSSIGSVAHGAIVQASEAAKRASARSACIVRREMKRGLNSLATIASVAPWIGMFGTILGMLGSFKGCGGEKWMCMAATLAGLSDALWPTLLGLAVALTAMWFYRFLLTEVEALGLEMEIAFLDLANDLTLHRRR